MKMLFLGTCGLGLRVKLATVRPSLYIQPRDGQWENHGDDHRDEHPLKHLGNDQGDNHRDDHPDEHPLNMLGTSYHPIIEYQLLMALKLEATII